MITATNSNTIERSGVQTEGNFKINASEQAFRILSDGLYSDKIRAIIRELSCNAFDAHVDGNNLDTPFHVQLPNALDPIFKIRDFGIGLSIHDVAHVYTTYFESTKTDSNDFVGCLGLGSKSPFSYTDSFTVTSYIDGHKHIHSAFLNEKAIPAHALLSESLTDEPNGLEVSFPVKSCDYREFQRKAELVYKHFKLRPIISGCDLDIPEVEYAMEGTGWGLRKDGMNGAVAIMGNVPYPLDDIDSELSDKQNQILNIVPIDIVFKIGELEVSASRESLSYTPSTLKYIKERIDIISKEIQESADTKIKGCSTLWEARVEAYKLIHGKYNTVKGLLDNETFSWNGKPITIGYVEIDTKGLHMTRFNSRAAYRRYRYQRVSQKQTVKNIQVTENVRIFWNDLKTGTHVRCKQVLNEVSGVEAVYLISGTRFNNETDGDIAARRIELAIELGIDEILPISSIIRDKKVRATGDGSVNPLNSSRLLVFDADGDGDNSTPSGYWKKGKLRVNNGGMYVRIDRYKVFGENPKCYINDLFRDLESMGVDTADFVIIGAKTAIVGQLEEREEWTELRDYVKEVATDYLRGVNLSERIALDNSIRLFKSTYSLNVKDLGEIRVDKPLGKFIKRLDESIAIVGDVTELKQAIHLTRNYCSSNDSVKVYNFTMEWNSVLGHYPLMKVLSSWQLVDNLGHVTEYINAIDNVE